MGASTGRAPGVIRVLLALAGVLVAASLAGCAALGLGSDGRPPVIFVHGNGDSSALWSTTIWRFESNGWPRNRLHPIDFPYPYARDDDTREQPGRSSTADQMQHLSEAVERALAASAARRVVLVAHSRGGYAVRNYIENGGGANKVSHAILAGTPNHGVWAGDYLPGSEFNGSGPFLAALNMLRGPRELEITPGPRWLTLRSDGNDKYAQPDGRWIGKPGFATNVDETGPALKGARNVALGALDHREVAFHPRAFEYIWQFVTGDWPTRTAIAAESSPVLDGQVRRPGTNLPMAGVRVEVYEVAPHSGERLGDAVHARTTDADGRWGPLLVRPDAPYEFVVTAPGFATTHVYRSAFPRSSAVVHLRPEKLGDEAKSAGSVVTMSRPRGYFDLRRDRMSLDGATPPGIPPGVAGVSVSTLLLPEGPVRTVIAEFNNERIAVRSWPASANHVVIAELHY